MRYEAIFQHDSVSETAALEQVANYLARAWSHPSHDPELCAYLVMGNVVYKIRMSGGRAVFDNPFDMFATGNQFTTELCNIAIRNWN